MPVLRSPFSIGGLMPSTRVRPTSCHRASAARAARQTGSGGAAHPHEAQALRRWRGRSSRRRSQRGNEHARSRRSGHRLKCTTTGGADITAEAERLEPASSSSRPGRWLRRQRIVAAWGACAGAGGVCTSACSQIPYPGGRVCGRGAGKNKLHRGAANTTEVQRARRIGRLLVYEPAA
jgi:hypothetical protein